MPATGAVSFTMNVAVFNNVFPELAERAKDLSPLLNEIIDEWAKNNADKFAKSLGAEQSGVNFSPEPRWEPLNDGYRRSKQAAGFPDHLMVRTGALKAALTTEGAFFRYADAESAIFGKPHAPEELKKAGDNWNTRQTIFLDAEDMKTVSLFLNDYMTLGPKFRQIKAAATIEDMKMQAEFESMFQGGA